MKHETDPNSDVQGETQAQSNPSQTFPDIHLPFPTGIPVRLCSRAIFGLR